MTSSVDTAPKRHWAVIALKYALAIGWYLACMVSQTYFDKPDTSWFIRTVAILVVILPLVWGAFGMRSWMRKADEYQRLLMHRAMFQGTATAISVAIGWHCAGKIIAATTSFDMPIMCVPAWAVIQTLSLSHRLIAPTK